MSKNKNYMKIVRDKIINWSVTSVVSSFIFMLSGFDNGFLSEASGFLLLFSILQILYNYAKYKKL